MGDDQSTRGLFKSLFLTYFILVLHGVLIILLALLVVFFRGVVEYLPWILAGGLVLIASFVWLLWRKLRRSRAGLGELLDNPVLRDRSVELRFLGGVATLRLGEPRSGKAGRPAVIETTGPVAARIEDEESQRLRRLARLIKLHEAGEISDDEYQILRRELQAAETAGNSARQVN